MLALRAGRFDVARRLLMADGVDANVYDKTGDCALWLALDADQVRFLRARACSQPVANNARARARGCAHRTCTRSMQAALAGELVRRGASVATKDGMGNSLLARALAHPNLAIARFIVERDAPATHVDAYGQSAVVRFGFFLFLAGAWGRRRRSR